MRIIAGDKKGLILKSPKGTNTRPTSDKIKGSIFNIISNHITFTDKVGVDCFAGTGSLGLEFLSRGGKFCTFLDINNESIKAIKDNVEKTGYNSKSKVIKSNVFSFLNKGNKFDLFFIDPPYNQGLAQKIIDIIMELDLLTQEGLLVVETAKGEIIEISREDYKCVTERIYGDTKITIIKGS